MLNDARGMLVKSSAPSESLEASSEGPMRDVVAAVDLPGESLKNGAEDGPAER